MPLQVLEGSLVAPDDARFALAVSRFNDALTQRLVDGATDALRRHGVADEAVTLAWCPGAFELPLLAKKLAATGRYDAVVMLGAVVRGATPHFDYVAGQCASGTQQVALQTDVPVLFGVITTDTLEQAWERAGTKAGNKGADAALAALEMVSLLRQV